MKSPLAGRTLLRLEETPSTQDVLAADVRSGGNLGGVWTRHQSAGRGRFGRTWISEPDDSLTVSLAFRDQADHPRAYLMGMALAIAAAGALKCELQWPNDVVQGGRKLGGILTELIPDADGRRVPVVGMGLNLNQTAFPEEIEARATSLRILHGRAFDGETVLLQVLKRLEALPEPKEWSDLAPIWALFDATPGKEYITPSGQKALALGVGPEGQLLCSIEGESAAVMAADAIFGRSA